MKAIWNIVKHKYFAVGATIMILILPMVLVINQQRQELRGRAEVSTTLSFIPSTSSGSPLQKEVGDKFYLDLIINPGNNLVSLIKVDILYDPSKLTLSSKNPLVVNETVFPEVIEGPVYSNGRVQVVLSVGSDLSNAVSTQSRALTLNFTALGTTDQTAVSFGGNSFVYPIEVNNPGSENVLSSTSPAFIKID